MLNFNFMFPMYNFLPPASSMGKIILIICVLMFTSQHNYRVDGTLKYVNRGCSSDYGNYTQGSAYQQNLNLLFSNFSSQALKLKFYNHTIGDVRGLFQCREDLSLEVCQGCLEDATRKIVQVCPSYGEAIVWYNECMLRYANRTIFSMYEWSQSCSQHGSFKVLNYGEFAPIFSNTMDSLINDPILRSHKFATKEANLTLIDTLYCLAQCTPDLDEYGCNSCLETALAELRTCCNATISAKVFLPSCQLRYETHPFYNNTKQIVHSTPPTKPGKRLNSSVIVGIAVASSVGLGLLIVSIWLCMVKTHNGRSKEMLTRTSKVFRTVYDGAKSLSDAHVVQYDLATLRVVTNDFSINNKLGEGGFGIVYKGSLKNGEEIAIKRLSPNSRQGATEFMNEARLVAKLQHRNLVKLVGFCSEGQERLLVYEFMPNTSLDHILFDPTKQQLLGWQKRYKIIIGIARGLQYLHEDSRLTIIHRDLKAGNILLDGDMNPKIADFGTAKLFGDEQKLGNTSRIVGTYGYMAPEYVLTGEYSEKSDVYSFGVMVLEIVSSQRNRIFLQSPQKENLLVHAWRLWNEGRSFELINPTLYYNCSRNEVTRCVQIGMLCVQSDTAYRPTMGAVVLMLTGSVALPLPSAPMMVGNDTYNDGTPLKSIELDQSTTMSTCSNTEVERDFYHTAY